jgi:hypothetical protein
LVLGDELARQPVAPGRQLRKPFATLPRRLLRAIHAASVSVGGEALHSGRRFVCASVQRTQLFADGGSGRGTLSSRRAASSPR